MPENPLPIIYLGKCTRCGACVTGCPQDALTLTEDGPVFKQPSTCNYCTVCEALCPESAIRTPLTVRWAQNV